VLVGCRPGERCVIERKEDDFVSRDDDTVAANDWLRSGLPWEPRVAAEATLTRTSSEAMENSRTRREHISASSSSFGVDEFGWVSPPVLNSQTRLAVEMCPGTGALRVIGYESADGQGLPEPVARIYDAAVAA
jgi:hypothetical protein